MTERLCGKRVLITCPSLSPTTPYEVTEFSSTGPLAIDGWLRSSVTVKVTGEQELPVTVRTMGSTPIPDSVYATDGWLAESGTMVLSYFDGSPQFQTSPYFAGWNADDTSSTGKTLSNSSHHDNTEAHALVAVSHLKSQLPDYLAIGAPYRVSLDGVVDGTPITNDPTFTKTFTSTVY